MAEGGGAVNLDEIRALGARLAELCRKYGIAERAVFGSAARHAAGSLLSSGRADTARVEQAAIVIGRTGQASATAGAATRSPACPPIASLPRSRPSAWAPAGRLATCCAAAAELSTGRLSSPQEVTGPECH
jgi:hypothetical protein